MRTMSPKAKSSIIESTPSGRETSSSYAFAIGLESLSGFYADPKTLLQPQNYFGCHRVMEEDLDIAVIAPCYNEEVTIGGVIGGFKSVMKGITA